MNKYSADYFHDAVERGYIQTCFQPIYRTVTNKILGAEALARWIDADGRLISPADFIPELEKGGLIYDLDMEILRQTCAFYQELVKRGTSPPAPTQGKGTYIFSLLAPYPADCASPYLFLKVTVDCFSSRV